MTFTFDKKTKIAVTILLGTLGIYLSTLVLAPRDMNFWAEFAKFAPGVLISILAFVSADDSKNEAKSSRETAERAEGEARTGREKAEQAESEARSGRERAERAEKAVSGTRKERQAIKRENRKH